MSDSLSIKTIGVYGSTEESFFNALIKAEVDILCDVRQRRGVRGAKYAYVNSNSLQKKLQFLGIKYIHIKALAPSTTLREQQKRHDDRVGTSKTQREELNQVFVDGYRQQNLEGFTLNKFKSQLPPGSKNVCFFCVERAPRACHRYLVAEFLANDLGISVENLMP